MDSTMGFTALDGLPMGTRCGSLDPGVVLYLIRQKGMTPDEVETLLYRDSGLRGISGVSNDMRVLLESDAPEAAEAVDYFVYRIGRELGTLVAVLGGVDGLVFTAGIGVLIRLMAPPTVLGPCAIWLAPLSTSMPFIRPADGK